MAISFFYWAFGRVVQLIRLVGRGDSDLAVEVRHAPPRGGSPPTPVHRPALEPADRAVLAALARLLPHWRLGRVFVPPENLLRWHRDLVASRWMIA